jgi:predicted  nucleic acid-binding Zn-ribbon protein
MSNKPKDMINGLRNEVGKSITSLHTRIKKEELLSEDQEARISRLENTITQLDNALGWAIAEIKKLQPTPITEDNQAMEDLPILEETKEEV